MEDSSSSSSTGLSDASSPVLEVSGKIVIAGVIIVFIVVIVILALNLYARCLWPRTADSTIMTWRRQLAGGQQQQGEAGRRRRPRGLDKSTLDSIPVVAYNLKEFKEGLECAVCLCELQEGDKTRLLPRCNHMFHADCVDVWFQSHSTCPICRDHLILVVSDSDSDTNSLDSSSVVTDDDSSGDDGGNSIEVRGRFPTNVLFWGDETQVRSLELPSEEGTSQAAGAHSTTYSNANNNSSNSRIGGGGGGENPNPNGMLVINIPCENCSTLSTIPVVVAEEEEANSPMATRLRSLKRLLSRGKRIAPSPSSSPCSSTSSLGSSSGDAEHV